MRVDADLLDANGLLGSSEAAAVERSAAQVRQARLIGAVAVADCLAPRSPRLSLIQELLGQFLQFCS